MKKALYVWLGMTACILSGCRLESPTQVVIDNKVDIFFINHQNQDLLDTAVHGCYYADSIHLYNLVRGVKTEINNRANYPHNFYIYKNEFAQKNAMQVVIEVDSTLLRLNEHTTDTITCTIDKTGDNFIIRKVWYNGILKWEDYAVAREITVVK